MQVRLWMLGGSLALCVIAFGGARGASGIDPAPKGATLFANRCARCHGVDGDGDGGLAPSLIGVVGRRPAGIADYLYSDALKAKQGVWSAGMLDRYLADPQAFAPGSDMELASPDPDERAAVIDYIGRLAPPS